MTFARVFKVTACHLAVFCALGAPWLARLGGAIPLDDYPADGWLIVWVLDWVRHALSTAPATLFDPPVNYPAPAQLAGSEHFLASQVLYAPLAWATGDPLAAANLTAFLSYPLAAAAMQLLLLEIGIPVAPAFAGALLFGLGTASGRLHVLQLQHLHLPLTALALHRLRLRPTWGRAAFLTVTFVLLLFSSYHMAVYGTVAAGLWGAMEAGRRAPERRRFVGRAAIAFAIASALLVWVSRPYFARPETRGDAELIDSTWKTDHLVTEAEHDGRVLPLPLVVLFVVTEVLAAGSQPITLPLGNVPSRPALWLKVVLPALFPMIAIGALAWTPPPRRRAVIAALAIGVAGALLVGPVALDVAGWRVPLPPAWLRASPARFIRVPGRAMVLIAFAGAILVAQGIAVVGAALPRTARVLSALVALACIVNPRTNAVGQRAPPADTIPGDPSFGWSRFAPPAFHPALSPEDRAMYALIGEFIVRMNPGPLVQVPKQWGLGEAVLGQMIHRQPTILFYTGYTPVHVRLVRELVKALPGSQAVDDLIDLTELRWILVRPEWHKSRLEALRAHPRTRSVTPLMNGFTLVQLDGTSRHPEWLAAVADGQRPGRTVLGAPLVSLPPATAVGITANLPTRWPVGAFVVCIVNVTNLSATALPVAPPGRESAPFTTVLEWQWTGADGADGLPGGTIDLRRDVLPGETIQRRLVLPLPTAPGRYEMALRVAQRDGPDLASDTNPIRVPIDLDPEPAPP